MDGFLKRTTEKRQSIIEAALKLMSEKQSRFTISELARTAHVSPVSIYNYFGSKEQVVVAAITQLTDEQLLSIESQIQTNEPFERMIIHILEQKVQSAVLFDETITQMIQKDESFQPLIQKGYIVFEHLIEYGKKTGAIDPSLSTESYLRYVHLMQQAILSDPDFTTQNMKDSMQDYFYFFLNGIMRRND